MRLSSSVILFLLCLTLRAGAATTAETRSFNTASNQFQGKLFALAEKSFADFAAKYPQSDLRPPAILFQAQARFFQTNYAGAAELLQGQLAQAGTLADQFQYRMASAYFELGKFREAAEAFAAVRNFPASPLKLMATYNQAFCESKLSQWSRVIELLRDGATNFPAALAVSPGNETLQHGVLLLAEAHLAEKNSAQAAQVLGPLTPGTLGPVLKWEYFYLLTRLRLAEGPGEAALEASSNAVVSALATGERWRVGESYAQQGAILEKSSNFTRALAAYENDLDPKLSVELNQLALRKIVELTLAQGQVADAIQRLDQFIAKVPRAELLDLARLTLGELRLREFYADLTSTNGLAQATNRLQAAATNFDLVIASDKADLAGRAALDRGWCWWAVDDMAQARSSFGVAAQKLPVSQEQAVAHFKLADAHFKLGEFSAAASNYNFVVEHYSNLRAVREDLFPHTLYQLVRAALKSENLPLAQSALARLLADYPGNLFQERSLLLVGQELGRNGSPVEARKVFEDFLQRAPQSDLLPRIELAIGRSYALEHDFARAIESLDRWVTNHAESPWRAEGEFSRALAYARAGQETNALPLFTNFIARFPVHELAPIAQNWVADFFWNHGQFPNAEKNFQLLSKMPSAPRDLVYRAWQMSGRCAFESRELNTARTNFTELINLLSSDTNAPAQVRGEAYFALGDTIFEQFLANPSPTNDVFREAVTALTAVTREMPGQAMAARAWGRIGDCYFQFAAVNKNDTGAYHLATNAYWMALSGTNADLATQSQAAVGLGLVAEKQGQLDAALGFFSQVVHDIDGQTFDPKWVERAAVAAARICETQEKWEQAILIYQRLGSLIPALREIVAKKIAQAQMHLDTAKN